VRRGWQIVEEVHGPGSFPLFGLVRSWSQIQAELGVSKGTAQRAFAGLPKIGLALFLHAILTVVLPQGSCRHRGGRQ
jgi:hypothetical protein